MKKHALLFLFVLAVGITLLSCDIEIKKGGTIVVKNGSDVSALIVVMKGTDKIGEKTVNDNETAAFPIKEDGIYTVVATFAKIPPVIKTEAAVPVSGGQTKSITISP